MKKGPWRQFWDRFWFRMIDDPFFAYVMVYLFIGVIIGIIGILYGFAIGDLGRWTAIWMASRNLLHFDLVTKDDRMVS